DPFGDAVSSIVLALVATSVCSRSRTGTFGGSDSVAGDGRLRTCTLSRDTPQSDAGGTISLKVFEPTSTRCWPGSARRPCCDFVTTMVVRHFGWRLTDRQFRVPEIRAAADRQ